MEMLNRLRWRSAPLVALGSALAILATAGNLRAQGLKVTGYGGLGWTSEQVLLDSSDPSLVLTLGQTGGDLYAKHCSTCHGEHGEGDGPAAAAFTPPPSDLTDAARMEELSDEELLEVIANGKGTMPGYSASLDQDEIAALVQFVRSLADKAEKK
jgi:high-affinity iron transporter